MMIDEEDEVFEKETSGQVDMEDYVGMTIDIAKVVKKYEMSHGDMCTLIRNIYRMSIYTELTDPEEIIKMVDNLIAFVNS